MKTKYFSAGALPHFILLAFTTTLLTSCSSHQNRTYNDNDGIYGNGAGRAATEPQSNANNLYYQDYFSSFSENDEEAEIFTDVDSYRTADNNSEQAYSTGNAGWGNSNDNITINVYDNNWGYGMWNNYWYGGMGWNMGWGWNSWYGPGWGMGWNNWYGPGWGWGWNNFYGPGYGWAGYGNFHPHHYSHNTGIRGVRNDMYGRSSRSAIGNDRSYNTGRRVNPNYSSGTRNTNYTGTRNSNINTRRNAVQGTRNTGTRTRSYNPSTTTRQQPTNTTRNNSYTPTTRSASPSSGGVRSSGGGGRSSGGGSMGGGRSGGGGGGRR